MISDKLGQADVDPEKDYHLKGDIRRVLEGLESDLDCSDMVEEELEALPSDHPVFDLIEAVDVWESSGHEDFENGIRIALTALDDLHELALENEWYSVASYSLLKSIEYREDLSGFDPTTEFGEVLDFLHTRFYGESDVLLGEFRTYVQKMLENLDAMDNDGISSLLDLVEDWATQQRKNKNYTSERDFLEYQITIKNQLEEDISSEQSRMIESYEDEFEQKRSAKSAIKASILERAVATCQSYLPDEKENSWRLKIRKLNKEGIKQMPRREEEIDISEDVFRIVDQFKQAKKESSSWEALAMLLYSPVGQGDFEKALEIAEEHPAANMFPRHVISGEGDSVGSEPGFGQEGEKAPSSYIPGMEVSNYVLAVALHQLIDENKLFEADFYNVLSLIPGVSIQDEAFLTDALINLFEGRYAESIHIAIPRLESITANLYQEVGKAVTKNQGTVYEQKGLGGLFD
ncbi:hypothetical protein [Halopenitus persicus]|nr:hypothetical protein [Halopenitus persicus]